MYEALVIGGGIVGLSAAYHLVREGITTLLIDRADAGRATDAGAGIIAPESSGIGSRDAWFRFGVRAGRFYPLLINHLREDGAEDSGYTPCGELIVAVDADEEAAFDGALRVIEERRRRWGVPPRADCYEIAPDDARALFPPLAAVRRALYYSKAARVDGRVFSSALRAAAAKRGLTIKQAGVQRLIVENGAVAGVVADGEILAARRVVIAGGAWSSAFSDQLGVVIPVEPQRGQIAHLRLPDADTAGWPIVTAFHGHYLVAWPGGRVAAGATRETGSGYRVQTTVSGIQEVLHEVVRVAPGLADAQLLEMRVGLRPHTRDSLPVLGTVPGTAGVFLATGHGATGLQLGPLSGKLAADWAAGRDGQIDISAFSVTRF